MTYLAVSTRQALPLLGNSRQGLSGFQFGEIAGSVSGTDEVDVGISRRLGLTIISNLVGFVNLGVIKLPAEGVARGLGLSNMFGRVVLYPGLIVSSVLELVGLGDALQFLNGSVSYSPANEYLREVPYLPPSRTARVP